MATYDNIPLSWSDPLFGDNVNSGSVTVPKGGSLSNVSITQTGSTASVVLAGGATLDDIRISSREGVRIGGSGNITINDAYIEATGQPGDHADGIQAYAPGSSGTVTITNTEIVAHSSNAAAGMFVADYYTGTFTFDNVVFYGGPYGLRINNDGPGEDYVSLTNVYFVGPFGYGAFLLQEVNAQIHITHWENVRYATIENGVLVPGALIPPPWPVEGGGGGAGSLSINDVTISEGNSGTKVATFTVTRSGGTAAFDVNYATANGTATVADSDYAAASNTPHFGANQNTQTISVTINGDTKIESNETFNVLLSNATNSATISDSQGVGTITNDDSAAIAGSVSINDVTVSEGNSGTKVATFTVARSGGTAAFDVNYATSNGTATVADSDYAAASNTLHFGANQNTQTISVTINGDTKIESNETFNVVLSNATNGATISDSQAVGTITNDDGTPIYSNVSYTLPANARDLVLTGTAAINGMGNSLNNTIVGNSNNNMLDGAAGADVLIGDAGNDSYIVDNAGDVVVENVGQGTDTVYSTDHFRLLANVESLVLQGSADLQGYGNDLVNSIVGNTGNNLLDGGGGADGMIGGAGNDAYFVDNPGDAVVENAGQGIDTIYSTAHFRLSSNVENLVLQGSADLQGYGNDLANSIVGNSGNNLLDGGAGADGMIGGAGNDAYFVDNPGDAVVENAGQGADTVYSTAHFRLSANVENLLLQGSADLQGYGNDQANTLIGNGGNNLLDGGAGADTMWGGAGNDVYFVDNAGDLVFENPSEGADAVFATVSYTLPANVETLVLQGTGNLSGTGDATNNNIYGNSGDNTLDGGAGADMLMGNGGNDTFVFNAGQAGGDTVLDFAGNGANPGDSLRFVGYGPGATFTNIDSTHWQINYNGGTSHEIITFSNAASIHPSDFIFV
jgi:Ca2+-binding RTX toxin-like protein